MKSTNTILFAVIATAGLTFCASPKIAKDLENADPGANIDVIVQFKQAPTAAQHKKVTDRGGVLKTTLSVVKAGLYSIPAGKLADLAGDPEVTYVSPNRSLTGSLDYAGPTVGADIALKNGFDGSGVGVAVIDSGITDHWDLRTGDANVNSSKAGKSRIVYEESFVPANSNGAKTTKDEYGHGTHVAGVIAGNAVCSDGKDFTRTFRGMANQAQLVNLRVLDINGGGKDSYVIAAIQRAIELKSQYNIRVINLSLGRPVYESYKTDPLNQAVEAAWKAGIVVVAAAGNDGRNNSGGRSGYGTVSSPANDPYVITVGAMKTNKTPSRSDDAIASYSSKGPTYLDHIVKPDLVAPGNQIVSLMMNTSNWISSLYPQNVVPYSYYRTNGSNIPAYTYVWLSGTSMAAPMVSGAAALMIQKDPTLTPDTVKARLMKTATKSFPTFSTATDPITGAKYTSQYDIFTIGAGYLDVWAALNNTGVMNGAALSPIVRYDSTSGKTYLVNAINGIWGDNGVWGDNGIWGDTVVSSTGAVWGDNGIWGDKTTQGYAAIWGDTSIWGASSTAANNATSASTSLNSPESTKIAIYGEQ